MTKEGTKATAAKRRPTLDDEREFVNILYYGDPGSGKTTAAAWLAKRGRTIIVDAEAGLKPGPLRRLGIPVENIEPHREVSAHGLKTLYRELVDELAEDPDAVAGVVLDPLSEIQHTLLSQGAKDPLLFSQNDYGRNTEELGGLIRNFRDLPCHLAVTAHLRRDVDEDDGVVKYAPSITPSLGRSLVGYVDCVCYVHAAANPDTGEPDYLGEFRPVGKMKGKDRLGVLPPRLINPTRDRIIAYADGTYRREAQLEADKADSNEIPAGLDPEQYEYRQRATAARKARDEKERAA